MTRGIVHTSTFLIKQNGILTNANSIPFASVYRNGVLTSINVTIQFLSIGIYSYSFTVPENWNIGDIVDIHITAVVDSFNIYNKIKEEITVNTSLEMRELIISGLQETTC